MSRVKVSPTSWRDEGPQSPYSPNVRLGGAMVTAHDATPPRKPSSEAQSRSAESTRRYYWKNRERLLAAKRKAA